LEINVALTPIILQGNNYCVMATNSYTVLFSLGDAT